MLQKGKDSMAKKLVIVESPHKSKTIEKYLGNDYKVVSSVRDILEIYQHQGNMVLVLILIIILNQIIKL